MLESTVKALANIAYLHIITQTMRGKNRESKVNVCGFFAGCLKSLVWPDTITNEQDVFLRRPSEPLKPSGPCLLTTPPELSWVTFTLLKAAFSAETSCYHPQL